MADRGYRLREERVGERGWWAVLGRENADDVFAFLPRGGEFLTLSLSLSVAASFWRERLAEILAVAAEYDVAVSSSRDEAMPPGEVYVNLAQRLFLDGLTAGAVGGAAGTLDACRDALHRAFPPGTEDGA
jgi:hypothetical protein